MARFRQDAKAIQVYSVTVVTHVIALKAGQSSQGISEPITPAIQESCQILTFMLGHTTGWTDNSETGCNIRYFTPYKIRDRPFIFVFRLIWIWTGIVNKRKLSLVCCVYQLRVTQIHRLCLTYISWICITNITTHRHIWYLPTCT